MTMVAADCVRQILDVGKLVACRSFLKVGGKLIELICLRGISLGGGRLGGGLQVLRDLLRDLLILCRVLLLELLQGVQYLCKRRNLVAVLRDRRRTRGTGAGNRAADEFLDREVGDIGKRVYIHIRLIGTPVVQLKLFKADRAAPA